MVASVIMDDIIGLDVTAKLMLPSSGTFAAQHAVAHSAHAAADVLHAPAHQGTSSASPSKHHQNLSDAHQAGDVGATPMTTCTAQLDLRRPANTRASPVRTMRQPHSVPESYRQYEQPEAMVSNHRQDQCTPAAMHAGSFHGQAALQRHDRQHQPAGLARTAEHHVGLPGKVPFSVRKVKHDKLIASRIRLGLPWQAPLDACSAVHTSTLFWRPGYETAACISKVMQTSIYIGFLACDVRLGGRWLLSHHRQLQSCPTCTWVQQSTQPINHRAQHKLQAPASLTSSAAHLLLTLNIQVSCQLCRKDAQRSQPRMLAAHAACELLSSSD